VLQLALALDLLLVDEGALVLSKSRTKNLPAFCSTAQWRLLMIALAGRRLHWGSRPMTNCDKVMGILCPLAFPSDSTTKLSFMRDLTPVVDKLTGACVNAGAGVPA